MSDARRYLTLGLLFAGGLAVGLTLWDMIRVPYSNPEGARGSLSVIEFSPHNNSLRFIVFLLLSVLPLLTAFAAPRWRSSGLFGLPARTLHGEHRSRHGSRGGVYVVLLFVALVTVSHFRHLNNAAGAQTQPTFDHYHDGQSLAPAVAHEQGQIPYRDFFYFRGAIQDPLRALMSFELLGRSLASMRVMEAVANILTYVSLGILLILLFRRLMFAAFAAATGLIFCVALGFGAPFVLWERDILTLLFLTFTLLAVRHRRKLSLILISFFIGLLPAVGFAYSLDRGFFLMAELIVLWPILYRLILRDGSSRKIFAVFSALGFGCGVLLLGWTIKWNYAGFLEYAFIRIPRYKELVDGLPYELGVHLKAAAYRVFILVLGAAPLFWICYKFLQSRTQSRSTWGASIAEFLRHYFFEFALLLCLLLNYRYGLGHADRHHIAAAASYATLFVVYVAVRYYLIRHLTTSARERQIRTAVLAVYVAVMLLMSYRFVSRDVVKHAYPLGRSDQALLTEDYLAALDYLNARVTPDAKFVSLTNEGSWYYLLDQPAPTGFSEIMFAATDSYQKMFIAAMERDKVEFVLYRNKAVWNHIDDMDNRDRIPDVFEYVEEAFVPDTTILGHEIWRRR